MGKAIIAAALLNSAYSFAWDVKMDWGLGQPGSRRRGLRNTLLISHEDPWPYYAAVGVDLVLRLAWVARLADGRFRYMDMVLTLELVEVRCRLGSLVRVLDRFWKGGARTCWSDIMSCVIIHTVHATRHGTGHGACLRFASVGVEQVSGGGVCSFYFYRRSKKVVHVCTVEKIKK